MRELSKPVPNLLSVLSLEQVLRTIPSGLFLVDLDQHIVYWNAEAERLTGYSAAEAIGKHCSFLAGIPCGKGCGLYCAAVTKPILGIACSVKTRGGRRVTLLKNVDYLRNERGEIVGGVESFTDITRQMRLEKELRRHAVELEDAVRQRTAELEEERSQLRNVLDAMADFAYICSAKHEIQFMNRAMIDAFGSHVGTTCYKAFYGKVSPCEECPMGRILQGETFRQERYYEADGRFYEVIHTPLRVADGSRQKLAVFRDITDRKEAEERLNEANRDLDTFVHTVSHDLRAPLTPILGYAEFLKCEYRDQLDERVRHILDEIEGQGERMLAMIEDLLDLSRVGSVKAPAGPVCADKIVREVLGDLSDPINNLGIVVDVAPLPSVSVSESLLFQVFANLLGNAVRYAGGKAARIEVGGEGMDEWIRFYVRDHGPGIPPEERERIFELFYRGSEAGEKRGTGIGLATVRKIARLYGGRAWAEETPGGGSTFWVELPVQPG